MLSFLTDAVSLLYQCGQFVGYSYCDLLELALS